MSDRKPSPPSTESESSSEMDPSHLKYTSSSTSDDGTEMIVESRDSEDLSSDSDHSKSYYSPSDDILPDEGTMLPGSQNLTGSQSSTIKLKASPKRSRYDKDLEAYRKIQRISKEKHRATQIKKIFKHFLSTHPSASLLASQTLPISQALTTSAIQSPDKGCLKLSKDIEPSSSAAVSIPELSVENLVKENDDESQTESEEQFIRDRLDNLIDIIDEIEGLRSIINQRNFFETDKSESFFNLQTQFGEATLLEYATAIVSNLNSLQKVAEGLFAWCSTRKPSIHTLKKYMTSFNSNLVSTPYSEMMQERLGNWDMDSGSLKELGDATCLLQVENRLSALQQSLMVECHTMHLKYWLDKSAL